MPPDSSTDSGDDLSQSLTTPGYARGGSSDSERHYELHKTNLAGDVAWEDSNQQIQHTSDLQMDLHVDSSTNQAIFTLHGDTFLKGSSKPFPLYLFVYPENIQSIESSPDTYPPILTTSGSLPPTAFIPLRFKLTEPPTFIVPKHPLVPKARSSQLLDTIKALACVQDFSIRFNKLNLVPEIRSQLSSLPSVFSANELKTDKRRGALQMLYHGAGGEAVSLRDIIAATQGDTSIKEAIEETLPKYTRDEHSKTSSGRKRQRTSESSSPPPNDKHALLDFKIRLERLEKMVQESMDHTPCRYNTEEMDDLMGSIDNRIDDQLMGVHIELEEKVMEGTEELVAQKTEEAHEQLWDEKRDELIEEIRPDIKQELKEELREEIIQEIKRELREELREEMIREFKLELQEDLKQRLVTEIKNELFRDMAQAIISASSDKTVRL
ncbi:hypothetical protein QBC42DRAFT_256446 [Cladorrhinum samala]|uniref:Uncharacterized protein n=1 Tax=Cladorrhinum samala TaxID=585594 RepID=A0AAV9HCL2_9PEZI|nr:hypothetical protein QBC42DRAFT_256446 [Cladorrhinum samala]